MCFSRSYLKVLFSVGEGQLDRILGMMGEVQMTKMERLYRDILAFRHCRKEDLPSHVSPSLESAPNYNNNIINDTFQSPPRPRTLS